MWISVADCQRNVKGIRRWTGRGRVTPRKKRLHGREPGDYRSTVRLGSDAREKKSLPALPPARATPNSPPRNVPQEPPDTGTGVTSESASLDAFGNRGFVDAPRARSAGNNHRPQNGICFHRPVSANRDIREPTPGPGVPKRQIQQPGQASRPFVENLLIIRRENMRCPCRRHRMDEAQGVENEPSPRSRRSPTRSNAIKLYTTRLYRKIGAARHKSTWGKYTATIAVYPYPPFLRSPLRQSTLWWIIRSKVDSERHFTRWARVWTPLGPASAEAPRPGRQIRSGCIRPLRV